MKKLLCLFISVTLMICSTTATYAEIPSDADDMVETASVFRDCPFCGGTVVLYCTGSITKSEYTYGCTFSRHNENEDCAVEHVYCGTAGYCTSCIYDSDVKNPEWPYEKEHHHVERHHFDAMTEDWGSCFYS